MIKTDEFILYLLFTVFEFFICLTFREERFMMKHLLEFSSLFHGWFLGGVDGEVNKSLKDIAYSLVGRMNHVLLVETIIAKFIEEDLVSRKIVRVMVGLAHLIHRQQQGCLAQLVLVETILEMAER